MQKNVVVKLDEKNDTVIENVIKSRSFSSLTNDEASITNG